tara:strand:- start:57909 stop:58208 length:300 start_codon:yes stop_codon:yes gene_type:complete
MTIDPKCDVKRAFEGTDKVETPAAPEVPERIKQDAPKPVLRPGGSWAARADAIDQAVREQQDAARAKNDEGKNGWAARIKRKSGRGLGMGFRRSAEGDE